MPTTASRPLLFAILIVPTTCSRETNEKNYIMLKSSAFASSSPSSSSLTIAALWSKPTNSNFVGDPTARNGVPSAPISKNPPCGRRHQRLPRHPMPPRPQTHDRGPARADDALAVIRERRHRALASLLIESLDLDKTIQVGALDFAQSDRQFRPAKRQHQRLCH